MIPLRVSFTLVLYRGKVDDEIFTLTRYVKLWARQIYGGRQADNATVGLCLQCNLRRMNIDSPWSWRCITCIMAIYFARVTWTHLHHPRRSYRRTMIPRTSGGPYPVQNTYNTLSRDHTTRRELTSPFRLKISPSFTWPLCPQKPTLLNRHSDNPSIWGATVRPNYHWYTHLGTTNVRYTSIDINDKGETYNLVKGIKSSSQWSSRPLSTFHVPYTRYCQEVWESVRNIWSIHSTVMRLNTGGWELQSKFFLDHPPCGYQLCLHDWRAPLLKWTSSCIISTIVYGGGNIPMNDKPSIKSNISSC